MTGNILLLTRSEMSLGKSNFSDYLVNLEDYEERLVLGEIQW